MNIGIDFNTKTTKVSFSGDGSDAEDCNIFEVKNTLTFSNGDIFVGNDGFNKYLTEKDSTIYDLDQIIEWDGLVLNKKHISTEKCLSIIFAHLINKIKTHDSDKEIGFICISIPYDKYYYWHSLIDKAFSLIEIKKIKIISQPAAFFCQPNINYLRDKLDREYLRKEEEKKYLYNQTIKKYEELPWHKKVMSNRPGEYRPWYNGTHYLFISISQDNINVSSVDQSDGVLVILNTQYTNSVTRKKIENSVFNYFVSEINKDTRNFAVKDQKTLLRIKEVVNEFFKIPQIGDTFELNLPYILCEDGSYQTLDIKIDLPTLRDNLAPKFNNLVEVVKQLALKTQETQIGNVIVIGDLFIQQNIKELLPKVFDNSEIIFGSEKSLVTGSLESSKVIAGEKKDFLALEVIPFSILVRLRGGEFVEVIKKDTTMPAISKEISFEINSENKSKFVEVHLTTKEGEIYQSLNVWKIEAANIRALKVTVDIDANMKIGLNAYSGSGQKLSVQMGNTFSFSGADFEVGIKGKDIRQYILNQFNYLNAAFEKKEVEVFEPDENFYSTLKDGEPFKALRYLGHFLKLKSLPDVELAESKHFEEQGISGFISGSKISIPKYFVNDPYGFGYVLAHELAHYVLIHEEQIILDNEQENEILTEIFVIYSGMGKLFLNGFKSKDVDSSLLHTQGYLNEKILGYIHQIYFSKFNINLHEYKNNLTSEAIKILNDLSF